ncbi:MAG TPA: peptidoglycan DD-metalloendopeptidase family protein [Bacteroidales bacterium]|nr:peptidoglycan DD-metalloendopeptidase family protein [Bacteroidales bacterium]HPT00994.1 peptidoglycan DD-metalloendopeptidase family protein [Bacteroidales bacterium]
MAINKTTLIRSIAILTLACIFLQRGGYVSAQELSEDPAGGDDDSTIMAPMITPFSSSVLPEDLDYYPLNEWYPSWDNQYVRLYHNIYSYKGDSIYLELEPEESGCFTPPVKGQLVSPFGYRGRRIHAGVDLMLNYRDTVVAAFPGVVRMARYFSGYGNCVVIRHYNGLETLYGHLSKISVSVNQKVNSGELIGLGGSTGRATCNHLHFETRFMGDAFNPKQLIDFDHHSLIRNDLWITPSVFGRSRDYLPSDEPLAKQEPVAATSHKAIKTKAKYHKIKSGDTLYSIANRNGTTVKKLCSLNHMKQSKVLKPGSRIRVK